MSEQRSREAPESVVQPLPQDEVQKDELNPGKDEYRSYSLDLLVMLEA